MPNPFKKRTPMINIKKNVYTMVSSDENSAEITMYGDIYEQRPTNWLGEPIDGQFITLSEFLTDLEQLNGCKDITMRIHSYGGDAGASNTIHNRLRELARNGANLTCIVDGVAMSGGSLIMCACDTVRLNPGSLIMIHKSWIFLWGGYNADELREQAAQQDAWDRMQIEIYKRKCKLSEQEIEQMMSETTYMTGKEAVEKGFADEIIADADPVNIAASADGRSLFVNGRQMHLSPGMFVPDNVPTATYGSPILAKANNLNLQNGGKTMVKNLEELRKENPDLAEQLIAEARAATPGNPIVSAAPEPFTALDPAQAECQRIREIDALAGLYDAETINEAKYGDNACTAQEMCYRAAQAAAKNGQKFLVALKNDTKDSGVLKVGAVATQPEDNGHNATPQQRMAAARANIKSLLGKER